jgi:flagella basal body P-ring formation protein FlgA
MQMFIVSLVCLLRACGPLRAEVLPDPRSASTNAYHKGYATEEVVLESPRPASTGGSDTVTPTVVTMLRSYVESQMPWKACDTNIDIQTPLRIAGLPSGKTTVEFECPTGYRYVGDAPFKTTILVDGKPCRTLYVKATVHPFAQVAVAARDMDRGEPIGEGDFDMVRKDLASAPKGHITDSSMLAGLIAAQSIPSGSVISLRSVERPLAVKRGSVVAAEVTGNGFRVSAKAKALDNGRVGDVIRLVNTDSRKLLVGEVVNGDTVRVVQ